MPTAAGRPPVEAKRLPICCGEDRESFDLGDVGTGTDGVGLVALPSPTRPRIGFNHGAHRRETCAYARFECQAKQTCVDPITLVVARRRLARSTKRGRPRHRRGPRMPGMMALVVASTR